MGFLLFLDSSAPIPSKTCHSAIPDFSPPRLSARGKLDCVSNVGSHGSTMFAFGRPMELGKIHMFKVEHGPSLWVDFLLVVGTLKTSSNPSLVSAKLMQSEKGKAYKRTRSSLIYAHCFIILSNFSWLNVHRLFFSPYCCFRGHRPQAGMSFCSPNFCVRYGCFHPCQHFTC